MSEKEQSQFESLFSDFKDAFACSEFGFISFTALELEIDTGYAAPIKKRKDMAGTWILWGQIEAHLMMLDTRVIYNMTPCTVYVAFTC